ncbi:MAG: cation diffusion facilitator family transporter [Gemmatimonadota bacterium]
MAAQQPEEVSVRAEGVRGRWDAVRLPEGAREPAVDPSLRERSVRRVLLGILVANAVVVVAKLAIGIRAGSLSVLGDAAHSAVDAFNNVFALSVLAFSAAPPDEEHPYGHGKFETLGAFGIAAFLSITCFELVRGALVRLWTGAAPPTPDVLAFAVLGGTVFVNVGVAVFETRRGRQLGSELLVADARHTQVDVLVTLSVLAGLGLARLGLGWADPVVALLVAGLVAVSGIEILKRTVPILVDHRAMDANRIRGLAEGTAGVQAVSDVRSRGRPGDAFAELTILVDPAMDVRAAHQVADQVERRLVEVTGLRNVVVHVEPSERGGPQAS